MKLQWANIPLLINAFTENNVTFACRQSPVQVNIPKTISLTFVGQLLAHEDDGTVNQHTEPVNRMHRPALQGYILKIAGNNLKKIINAKTI